MINFSALIAPLALTLALALTPSAGQARPLTPSLELQGHRGARGLAPENSLPAFHLAYLHGMTTLELDSTLTADGRLIIHHDTVTNLKLCTGPEGAPLRPQPLTELTQRQLRGLECGLKGDPRFPEQAKQRAHPPLLSEVVQLEGLWGASPLYNLEIKTDKGHTRAHKEQAVEALRLELEQLSASRPTLAARLTLQSFDFELLTLVGERLPALRRSALFEPELDHTVSPPKLIISEPQALLQEAARLKVEVISPYHGVVTLALIDRAHAAGLKVIPWTVNEEPRMAELIKLGVDGLISDYPDRLSAVTAELGAALECRTRHADAACQIALPAPLLRAPRSPLIDLRSVAPSVKVTARYAGSENFLGRPVNGYEAARCLLTRPAAEALSRAQAQLQRFGLSLQVFDCYRPQRAVDDFMAWARDLSDQKMKAQYYPRVDKSQLFERGYIAKRSGHSRGSTVDLTIEGLDMGTPWDLFGPESHAHSQAVPSASRAHRALLSAVMRAAGFTGYQQEWWHFTLSPEPLPALYLDEPIR